MTADKNDQSKKENFQNPIDKDKITETPNTLEYGHHLGSAVVKPEDMGKVKGRALSAMEHQTDQQLNQLYEQMQLLAEQAKKINQRKYVSEKIYSASFRFDPIINHVYYLYKDTDETHILSIIGPSEWGRSRKNAYTYLATVKLLADHTWDIMDVTEETLF